MAFKISDIHSTFKKYGGPSKKPYFFVRLTPPKFLNVDYVRDFEFLCTSAALPGLHFDTTPIRPMGYGTSELRPYSTNVNQITMDLLVDAKGEAFNFFHKWMGNINNFAIDSSISSDNTKLRYYEFAYPEEYETVISIFAMDNYVPEEEEQQVTIEYTLNQSFPITLGDIAVNWNSDNDINLLPITFAYNMWSSKTLPYNTKQADVITNVWTEKNFQPATTNNPVSSSQQTSYLSSLARGGGTDPNVNAPKQSWSQWLAGVASGGSR